MTRCLWPSIGACCARCVATLLSLWVAGLAGDEPTPNGPKSSRRYREGPLLPDDFRGKVPAFIDPKITSGRGLVAYTYTEIMYETRFQAVGTRDRWTARLVHAEAYAVVHRDRSWNRRPADAELLDHEQGHFDLAHSFALAMQLYFDQQMKSRKLPVGVGKTSTEATQDLEKKLRIALQPILDDNVKAQTEYDHVTNHGTIPETQSEQRRQQLARIDELSKQLDVRKKKSPRPQTNREK